MLYSSWSRCLTWQRSGILSCRSASQFSVFFLFIAFSSIFRSCLWGRGENRWMAVVKSPVNFTGCRLYTETCTRYRSTTVNATGFREENYNFMASKAHLSAELCSRPVTTTTTIIKVFLLLGTTDSTGNNPTETAMENYLWISSTLVLLDTIQAEDGEITLRKE